MSITRITMPQEVGRPPIPNPIRYICDYGHVHPSHRHAVKCHRRQREAQERREGKRS